MEMNKTMAMVNAVETEKEYKEFWIPRINCGLCAGDTPMCWDGERFSSEEECDEWIDENNDNFTLEEMGGGIYPYLLDMEEIKVKNYKPYITADEWELNDITNRVEIFKEIGEFNEHAVTRKEFAKLRNKYCAKFKDLANGLYAFELNTLDYDVADKIIIELNAINEDNYWYVGCPTEEYVHCF